MQLLMKAQPEAWINNYLKLKQAALDQVFEAWDDCFVQHTVKLGLQNNDLEMIIGVIDLSRDDCKDNITKLPTAGDHKKQ